ncbi:MAG: GAF domain-containing protein [Oscillatoriales cyanobacterium]|uniref:histidine kinase n=1 Tax=Microcoleus anatoxicus PTRS2 TaxID=2705321 RepID=A0ABU8YQI0_9CYAN|nr:MAG: GAF domain-containing protein [Oscillatoriales cyanobacterium]TAD98531.1 MAG: GAF domain-containing protein [Oscillatoriales cyanobacterium]TAE04537.1 MAG: GAF domain-containing protein [Oscillatoriales cyanobacterium]
MNLLSGYKITEVVQLGVKSIIYRAVRESDGALVIIKTLNSDYPTIEEITRLKHEYQISSNLNIEGIIKPHSLEKYKNSFALILEDCGGESLRHHLAGKNIKYNKFLPLAIQLSQTLGEVHTNHIIHKDIKPSNIIVLPDSIQVKITDFSMATRLSKEVYQNSNTAVLEGTLAYISPEQTGRMNRDVDYRTDLYSLGVTFYEMLTGKLPFNSTDPLELIHSHIAVTPVPPHQLNKEVPLVVSSIVMKLLAKNAEDRYQSALGVKADLENCLNQLQTTGKIDNFIPGTLDKSGQFLIPQKLYGRTKEVADLIAAFDRVTFGKTEMVLVSGYSGIGKTSVVNEVHKPILRQRGYFIAGKFDQFKRDIPYAALTQAFESLMQQLLTKSSADLAIWKEKLLSKLGQNGAIIIEVVPSLELIIGSQPTVPQLGPTESQNRFTRLFKEFLNVFAQAQHLLVLFLDDLQWSDLASLKLLQELVTDSDIRYFLVVGAYRDNEVDLTHPLVQTVENIEQNGAAVHQIILPCLDLIGVTELLQDTFGQNNENLKLLADLIFNKTGGNPFFITQMLSSLHSEKLLAFDFNVGAWHWDLREIEAAGIVDFNVVELVARNIEKLPEETQQVLKLAACMGNHFSLENLAIVREKSPSETAADLWEALQAGLIVPLSNAYKIPLVEESVTTYRTGETPIPQNNHHPATGETPIPQNNQNYPAIIQCSIAYRFLHDRVQQATYSLIPDSQKKQTHLKIGYLLLEGTHAPSTAPTVSEIAENIFDIVNQLNIGVELIVEGEQRNQLANFNLIAGKKAKSSAAYEAALKYFNTGIELLPDSAWKTHYSLIMELHLEALELSYINTEFELAFQLSDAILSRAQNLLEKIKVYELKVIFYFNQNQPELSINTALKALKMLGVYIPKNPNKLKVILELFRTKLSLKNPNIEDLVKLPTMTNPNTIAAIRILTNMSPAAFIVAPNTFPFIVFKIVTLSLKYGNAPLSSFGYANYGVIQCGVLSDMDSGYRYGQIAQALLERFHTNLHDAQIALIFNAFISHWSEHVKKSLIGLIDGIQSGIETGDVNNACYCASFYSNYIFLSGEPLDIVETKQNQYIQMLVNYQNEFMIYQALVGAQLVLNLQGKTTNPCLLIGERFNETTMLPALKESNNNLVIFVFYLAKSWLNYLFKDYVKSAENAMTASSYAEAVMSMMYVPLHNFYYSLALLALYPTVSKTEQKKYLKKVVALQKKMKHWAVNSPGNYQHKYDLVEAEKARVLGQSEQAALYYDRAVKGASENEYIHEAALANELAAEFYRAGDRPKVAETYLIDAYYGYLNWGATAKVKHLESQYPMSLPPASAVKFSGDRTMASTNSTSSSSSHSSLLDLTTVLKASQALASEIVLDKLLAKLIKIAMENAGAQTGFLLIPREGKLVVQAAASVHNSDIEIEECPTCDPGAFLPITVINYVERTHSDVVLSDAAKEGLFTYDPYIQSQQLKSVLCTPIVNKSQLTGILYLENNLTSEAFFPGRLEILKMLSSQAAISIENAVLVANLSAAKQELEDYSQTLEVKVEERTQELKAKEAKLQEAQKLAHLGNWEFDLAVEKFTWSEEVFRIFGLDTQLPEPTFLEHKQQIHPESIQFCLDRIDEIIQSGNPCEFELKIVRPDGDVRYIFVKAQAIFDGGKVIKLFGTVQDITQRKLAEDALRESEALLREKASQLEVTLSELRSTQSQLIQTEKMSSLGQLVAGVAHEINNPINFIYGNVVHASDYSSDLLGLIELYQESYPNPTPEIVAKTEEVDLLFIQEDLPKMLQSMQVGVERVRNIVLSLRNFSRLDESEMKPVDIHSGIESTLLILQHKLKKNADGSGVEIIKKYGELPKVSCYASGLNQVFMNILSNAIDAVELRVGRQEKTQKLENMSPEIFKPKIKIWTEVSDKNWAIIHIADNGPGMTEEVRSRIFDPFFTTKAVGKGTGLGLSISYQIVVEKHGGKLICTSAPGEGTEFAIEIPVRR